MSEQPIFHEQTEADLMRFASRMPHALGMYGDEGIGLLTAATFLSTKAGARMSVVYPEKNDSVDIEKGTITIEIVRRLYVHTQGKSRERQCVIIVAADTMSQAAQNAFLKLLEEPTHNTSFILLAHHSARLLPTIRSRLQTQYIRPITTGQSGLLLDHLGVSDTVKRQQLLFMADGLPSRLTKLARDEGYFNAQAALLRQARTYIQGSPYERLLIAQEHKGSRVDAIQLVGYAVAIMKHAVTTQESITDDMASLMVKLLDALERLEGNGNPRLVLARVIF